MMTGKPKQIKYTLPKGTTITRHPKYSSHGSGWHAVVTTKRAVYTNEDVVRAFGYIIEFRIPDVGYDLIIVDKAKVIIERA